MKKLFLSIFIIIVAVWALWHIFTTPGLKPVEVSIYQPPILSVDNRIMDFGSVETGKSVQTQFLLYNVGGKALRIYSVDASCGCTVASSSRQAINPGDFSWLRVVIDTRLKRGPLRKTIRLRTNDPHRPETSLFVIGTVLPQKQMGHKVIRLKPSDRLVLFQGSCASCHVLQGRGKTGQALFVADCAMCHGINALGNHGSGPSLLNIDYDQPAMAKAMRDIIAHGSPNSPQMPPFSQSQGGPLSDDQIDSLLSFLSFQHTQYKMGLLNQPDKASQEDEAAFRQALRFPH